jgi:AcrR family transcriptional regulator
MEPDLRQLVLEAAVAAMREHGVDGLSMRDVARRAGVSHQAPYHHFGDREGILAALVEEGFRVLSERLEQALDEPGASRACLTRAVTAYVDFALERPEAFRLMFRSDSVDLARFHAARAQAERAYAALERLVRDHVHPRAGGTPAQWVPLVWGTAHGLAALLLDGRPGRQVRDAAARRKLVRSWVGTWAATVT